MVQQRGGGLGGLRQGDGVRCVTNSHPSPLFPGEVPLPMPHQISPHSFVDIFLHLILSSHSFILSISYHSRLLEQQESFYYIIGHMTLLLISRWISIRKKSAIFYILGQTPPPTHTNKSAALPASALSCSLIRVSLINSICS